MALFFLLETRGPGTCEHHPQLCAPNLPAEQEQNWNALSGSCDSAAGRLSQASRLRCLDSNTRRVVSWGGAKLASCGFRGQGCLRREQELSIRDALQQGHQRSDLWTACLLYVRIAACPRKWVLHESHEGCVLSSLVMEGKRERSTMAWAPSKCSRVCDSLEATAPVVQCERPPSCSIIFWEHCLSEEGQHGFSLREYA